MEALDTSRPWLVMTNAEDAWLADFGRAADAAGVRFVLEGDLRGLAGLDDNFLRYQTLQCLYGYAVHRIYTLKSLEAYCRVPGQRIELQPGHLCQGQGDPSHVVISGSKDDGGARTSECAALPLSLDGLQSATTSSASEAH
eukprot:CAMPEP_0204585802 /NCGR_PEP_ID=MMETSP0661-20131031/47130_1 /ASSEMBLY_ACC=CAM_ASM_000606 /TAXON_ID=109239 /ORGANISM="Alexandrium margalefi, Strain AMGDE01CS-322" /LENGTH=140 /DNA_ID=CAMNT_0051595389 /DNA_START=8 /DNA_END=431 /DNA_ORIENTATION=-